MENKDEYKTLDIGEAAALYVLGFELIRLEPTSRRKQRAFIFKDKETNPSKNIFSAVDVVRVYRSLEGIRIHAYSFFLALKDLKSRVYNDIEING